MEKVDRRISDEEKIPIPPQKTAVTRKHTIKNARSIRSILPYTKVSKRMGKLDTISTISWLRAENSFPITISFGVILVVNRSSRVCRSRSPLMLPEVSAGMINIKSRNSRVATKA